MTEHNFMWATEQMKKGEKVNNNLMDGKMHIQLRDDDVCWNDGTKLTHIELLGFLDNSKRTWEIYKEEDEEEKNPMDFCMGCDKYLGHRGFCSKECHNKWYDEMYSDKEEPKHGRHVISAKVVTPSEHLKDSVVDDWNLVDKVYGKSPLFKETIISVGNFKTFIQKVKKDVDFLKVCKQVNHGEIEGEVILVSALKKIIDKRTGGL